MSDVDEDWKLNPASALDMLQNCAMFHTVAAGSGPSDLKADHLAWVINSWNVYFDRPCDFLDTVRLSTWPHDFDRVFAHRNFTIENSRGETCVRADSVWILMQMEKQMPTRMRKELVARYETTPRLDMPPMERPTSGKVFIGDEELTAMSPAELRQHRKKIGMIFQQFNLFASRTVYDNVSFPLKGSNLTKEQKDKKVRDLLKLVELEEKASAYPSQLSGGQKQRVAIARALANDPEIILSDESTSALDPRTTRAILDLLKKVNRELGITIVVITHEMQVIKDICDRVAVMKDGRVVETGTVFDIFANPKEQITREFVENTSNMSRIYELVETKSPVVELKPGEAILRFRYLERNVSEALVSQLSRKFDLDLNIIFGSIELIGENPIGGLVVIAQGTSDNINQAIQYLKDKNVGVEVILDGRTA